jgi:hypothetical protein
MSTLDLATRVDVLERKDRERDRESGLLLSVDSSLTALSNWQDDHARRFEQHAKHTREALDSLQTALSKEAAARRQERAQAKAERERDRRAMVRLAAFPIGGISHLVFGQAEGNVTSPNAFVPALVVLVLCLLFPELQSVLLRRSEEGSKDPDPLANGNGAHHTDPPAPGH